MNGPPPSNKPRSATGETAHHRDSVADVVHRNIRSQAAARRDLDRQGGWVHRSIRHLVGFIGSIWFLGLNGVFYSGWILVNQGVIPNVRSFDPFPFPFFSTIACLESILLTTLVLINQNRMRIFADRRSNLNLHVDLLAEHEITRILGMLERIGQRIGIDTELTGDLSQLTRDTQPDALMREIEKQQEETEEGST